ncbi:MAG: hypothetical protein IPL64_12020 [Flavobacteriales bacterium]|nr:hypothetical protein [Flavobacteriales bacterium]
MKSLEVAEQDGACIVTSRFSRTVLFQFLGGGCGQDVAQQCIAAFLLGSQFARALASAMPLPAVPRSLRGLRVRSRTKPKKPNSNAVPPLMRNQVMPKGLQQWRKRNLWMLGPYPPGIPCQYAEGGRDGMLL